MTISVHARLIAGLMFVSVPSIQYGGVFLLSLLSKRDSGYVQNPLRQNLFRAGHAHAGVLVILGLMCQLFADAISGPAWLIWIARLGVPTAAILIPLGFFLSVASPNATKPGPWIRAVWGGAIVLGSSVLTLGILLIRSAIYG
jgi:hypothetical protein